jgi:two-component system cell cycle response regulator DivK
VAIGKYVLKGIMSKQEHILIVEDPEDDRIMFAQYLSMHGYRVSKAGDGKEGLEKAFELKPDLVLIDLWLPKVSGWEAIHRLRADQRTGQIPILVVTGYSSIRSDDCDGWLTKPCPLDQLGAEVAALLDRRAGESAH